MDKIRVGILRGGVGTQYEISLASGAEALCHIDTEKYKLVDIFVDREGNWYAGGLRLSVEKLQHTADVFLNFLHGETGENGKLKNLFENLSLFHTGSDALASSIALNKRLAKERFEVLGILTPKYFVASRDYEYQDVFELAQKLAKETWQKLSPPWVLKPLRGGSSVGVRVAKTFDELVYRLYDILHEYDEVLVEEYIEGDEIFVNMIDGFRGKENYISIPMLIQNNSQIFNHKERVTGDYNLQPYTNLHNTKKEEILNIIQKVRDDLGLKDFYSMDFIDTPKGIYLLEVDSHPATDTNSPMKKSMEHHGISARELLGHMIERVQGK